MSVKNTIKKRFYCLLVGVFLMLVGLIAPVNTAFAEPNETLPRVANEVQPANEELLEDPIENPETPENPEQPEQPVEPEPEEPKKVNTDPVAGESCSSQLSPVGWLVCPVMTVISKAVDSLYNVIEDLLAITPLSNSAGNPIYVVWQYCLNITNIVFIIFFLVVIYSQITGVGISNYGIKKVLPKLIIAAVLVNLSFHLCAIVVDVSNIVGSSLRGFFANIPMQVGEITTEGGMTFTDIAGAIIGGAGIDLAIGAVALQSGALWMLIPTLLGGLVAIISGLITIAMRQAVVILLVMISPLALVCYMLPNTESLFRKWKDLFKKMLVFYPMFSLLFGASSLAGWAIIANAVRSNNMFMLILGLAVQVFPLIGSWSLMKMSGTFLSTVNDKLRGFAAKPLAANRAWAESRRENTRAKNLARLESPSARLQQYLLNRKTLREMDTENANKIAKSRATIYANYKTLNMKDVTDKAAEATPVTRRAKLARTLALEEANSASQVDHALDDYKKYYAKDLSPEDIRRRREILERMIATNPDYAGFDPNKIKLETKDTRTIDYQLGERSAKAYLGLHRAAMQKEVDDENDINFMVDQFLAANKRDKYGRFEDPEAYERYIQTVGGEHGDHRVLAKIITQAAKVESKQRSEYGVMLAKWGHNGYNKREFRNFTVGYDIDDDGWAVDELGRRPRWTEEDYRAGRCTEEDYTEIVEGKPGRFIEVLPGDIMRKAPHRATLYNHVDENGLYFNFRDQNGNVLARIYRDGGAKDDAAFMKEVLSNYDIPIGDPINDIYAMLAGIHPGSIEIKDADNNTIKNFIGLDRYSTTIGRAIIASGYKGNAAWAGSMFSSMIGNRQITNSSEHAIQLLDSIVKTLKPGAFNTQNPASVKLITTILNPDNWDSIFDEETLKHVVNINNKHYSPEEWLRDEHGELVRDSSGNVKKDEAASALITDENATYEQRMNVIKRKLLFPALMKITPSFDRLRTSNTADNQKPGTADASYQLIDMVENKWVDNPAIPIDPHLILQDLPKKAREYREKNHDADGNPINYGVGSRGNRGGGGGAAPTGGAPTGGAPSGGRPTGGAPTGGTPRTPRQPDTPVDDEPEPYHTDVQSDYTDQYLPRIEGIFDTGGTVEEIEAAVEDFLGSDRHYSEALAQFRNYCSLNYGVSKNELYNYLVNDLIQYIYN